MRIKEGAKSRFSAHRFALPRPSRAAIVVRVRARRRQDGAVFASRGRITRKGRQTHAPRAENRLSFESSAFDPK